MGMKSTIPGDHIGWAIQVPALPSERALGVFWAYTRIPEGESAATQVHLLGGPVTHPAAAILDGVLEVQRWDSTSYYELGFILRMEARGNG